jgi:hypothetical protein
MANQQIQVGDPVITRASNNPKMVVSYISDEKATCYYFNLITNTFHWVELPLVCLVKVAG